MAIPLLLACNDGALGSGADSSASSVAGGDPSRICDGTADLRLLARLEGGGLVASELMREIGWSYIYVTGKCDAWVLSGDLTDPWREARVIRLSASAEAEISEALHYESWSSLAGEYATIGDDIPTYAFSDGSNTIACFGRCSEALGDVPFEVRDLDASAINVWASVYSDATPWDGAVRVTLTALGTLTEPDPCAAEWALSWPPSDIAVAYDEFVNEPGSGTLISEHADTAVFRALREDARGVSGCNLETGLRLRDGDGQFFNLFLRDSLPIESPTGLIPLANE